MNNEANIAKDKLVQDFKIVIADTEELLRATASLAGEKAASARDRIHDSLQRAKTKLADAEDALVGKSKEVVRAADDYVRENPWQAVGVGVGIGLLIGLLIGRR